MTRADGPEAAPFRGPREHSAHRIHLLVLDVPNLNQRLVRCRTPPLLTTITPGALTARLLKDISPDCVVFSLFSLKVDSLALLDDLRKLDYRGHVLAISPPLPKPQMVLAELRSHADGLRLRILTPR